MNNIYAFTELTGQTLPAYVSINENDGKYFIYVRTRGEEYSSVIEIPAKELMNMSMKISNDYINKCFEVKE